MPAETTPAGDGGGPEAAADLLEALPEGSEAAKQVKYSEQKRCASFTFQPSGGGQKSSFQVTAKQAGSSAERAQRVAELCYAKFEAGSSKDQVAAYRDELCQKLTGSGGAKRPAATAAAGGPKASPKAPPTKRPRPAGGPAGFGESLLEVLEREGRLEGALRIEGRVASKKNHESINGIFALLPEEFDGRKAYEKVMMGGSGLESCRRFLYFSASGKKWKISDAVGDTKGGYCYVRAADGGEGPPVAGGGGAGDASWVVFDGKDGGYNVDAAVRSSLLEALPKATSSKAGAKAAAGAEDSSSSSSSSSSDEAEAPDLATQASQASEPLQLSQSSQPAAGQASAAAAVAPTSLEPEIPSRVCAKAAVRSGLRCACHYSYADECPARKR